MSRQLYDRITFFNAERNSGYPDVYGHHFGHALADAYIKGAHETGYEVNTITVAKLDFPLLHSKEDWENSEPAKDIQKAQAEIERASHLVIFYPLWMGSMPALIYRWYFRAHSLKSLERSILGLCGIKPVKVNLIEMVEAEDAGKRKKWLKKCMRWVAKVF